MLGVSYDRDRQLASYTKIEKNTKQTSKYNFHYWDKMENLDLGELYNVVSRQIKAKYGTQ